MGIWTAKNGKKTNTRVIKHKNHNFNMFFLMMINHVKNNVLRSKKWEFNSEENKTNRHTQKKNPDLQIKHVDFAMKIDMVM
jgi:hypothetical protein